jgi:hypothetical protein
LLNTLSRLVGILAIAALPALPAHGQAVSNAGSQVPAGAGADAAELTLASKVNAIRITAVSTLPSKDGDTSDASSCSQFIHAPTSTGARAVRDAGWLVTGQAQVGGYQAVSFVGGLRAGTSGTCQLDDGNVALFKAGAIRAIVYGRKGVPNAIGMIRADAGVVKIHDGDVLHQPVALLRVADDGAVSVDPLPASESVCNGAATVPTILNMPINKARDVLANAGWSHAPRARPMREVEDPRAFDLASRGVSEVDSCSGTGMGYCNFAYKGPAGSLSVTTVGDDEWPTVARYGVTCK